MEVRKEFRRPSALSTTTAKLVAEEFDQFLTRLQRLLPASSGREQALVVTKLQEAESWAQRALTVAESVEPPREG